MRVKTSALICRKAVIVRKFGSDTWNHFFSDMARQHPCLRVPLTASSQVPAQDFLAFHDELVTRLYGGGAKAYFDLGEQSAGWALTEGPHRRFMCTREVPQLVKAMPRIWRDYFTETSSSCEASYTDGVFEVAVFGLSDWHPFFEHLVAGYVKGALELLCANPIEAKRVRGGSGEEYKYAFHIGALGPPRQIGSSPPSRRGTYRESVNGLTPREDQVLRLLAHGKTNGEIGALLGISERTVEIHVSHVYDKLGVCNRAGATLWVADHRARFH